MEEIEYVGEHLLPGIFGNIFLALSFSAALLSAFGFYCSTKNPLDKGWQKIGILGFRIHSVAVLGIILTLFYIITNHLFEYNYAWQHSNKAMPMRYLLSCFWEGQEGSFLLWTFWHLILGNILIKKAGEWQGPTMTVLASVQVFLASMLLGIYVLGLKIGSNPFILLRENPEMANLPFTNIVDYALKIDGRGLNPILQNYWMIIHPPTLFLGFASTLIPFCYAIAGFWKRDYTGWQKPALPWTFFAVMTLGTGVLMGGAWAYEALSFGGFWAWDPVENASLVPWLTLVGAAHVMLINKANKQSLKTSFILATSTFILVLYSTFLTRSGILGDSSVHAFTDLGMSGQLLIYLLSYTLLAILLLVFHWKKIPKAEKEDSLMSREFWMFIGSLVLLISAFQISFSTSVPVINKIFGTELAPPGDVITHYHSWQIPFAIIITLLIGIGQFLKYRSTDKKKFFKTIYASIVVSLGLTALIGWQFQLVNAYYIGLLFSSLFATIANTDYLLRILKGKIKKGGASIAHIGFGLIMLGALISTGSSIVISENSSGVDVRRLNEEFSNRENIMLSKNDTLVMGNYHVTFTGKSKEGINIYFHIDYLTKKEDGTFIKEFTLNPRVQMNNTMGNVAEPDTRHFFHKDIYTHITYADLSMLSPFTKEDKGPYSAAKEHTISIKDSIYTSNSIVITEGVNTAIEKDSLGLDSTDIAVGLILRVIDRTNKTHSALPIYAIKSNYAFGISDSIPELGLKFQFTKIDPHTGKVNISISEKKTNKKEFVIMKAIVFPLINVLWIGAILLIIGNLVAIRERLNKTSA